VQQSYSRPEETEADRGGMTLAHAAGYDPTAALGVLKRFQQLQGNTPSDAEIMFGTEPGDAQRVQSVKEYLQSQGWQGRYYQY